MVYSVFYFVIYVVMDKEKYMRDIHRYNNESLLKKYKLNFEELLWLLLLWDIVEWIHEGSIIYNLPKTLYHYNTIYNINASVDQEVETAIWLSKKSFRFSSLIHDIRIIR